MDNFTEAVKNIDSKLIGATFNAKLENGRRYDFKIVDTEISGSDAMLYFQRVKGKDKNLGMVRLSALLRLVDEGGITLTFKEVGNE